MVPGRLRGTTFTVANSRRATAHLYVNCLEVACHVTVSTSAGTVQSHDIEAESFLEIVVEDASGADQAIVVSSDQAIVMAVSDGSNLDYMPVPPVSPEMIGIVSTVLSIAAAGSEPMNVAESCSDESTATLQLGGAGEQTEQAGYGSQYMGKACRYTSMSVGLDGRPRTFGAHGYGDGDGGDSTPFLPPSLFSTDFVTPIDYEFLAFASMQPGTLNIDGATVELEGTGGVYKARVGAGLAGVVISSSVPVWAVLECAVSEDENLLYGNVGA
jgi:hypothetical protein